MSGEPGFHRWVNMTSRGDIQGKNFPGVYMIAKSKSEPSDYRANNGSIIYIGETTGQTLGDRIRQFSVSAYAEKPGHSGGNTFRTRLATDTPEKMLWVSVCPVDMGEAYTSAFIKYLERRLIWEYVSAYGERPECNST